MSVDNFLQAMQVIHRLSTVIHICAQWVDGSVLSTQMTVSYTHLDVYKRQAVDTQRVEIMAGTFRDG